jgi:stringent starvation protein B
MTNALPSKKDVALAFLERSTVRVFLDPRKTGVVVPPWFKNQPQLLLDIGLNTAIPIPDLHLDDDALSCTLSFNRSPFYCVLPWHAVFALVGDEDRAVVWPDDVPPEVQLESRAAPPPRPAPLAAVPNKPAVVQPIKGKGAKTEKPSATEGPDASEEPSSPSDRDAQPPKGAKPVPLTAAKEREPAPKERGRRSPAAGAKDNPKELAREKDANKKRPALVPVQGEKKPSSKKELPPYLRVIK